MDAAQMLTAQEIARQCARLAERARQGERPSERMRAEAHHGAAAERHLRLVDPITRPIPRVTGPGRARRGAEPGGSGELTDRERGILAFERQWWKRSGTKERVIRELFGMSESDYDEVLYALADEPEAYRSDPMLIKRLRKVRASGQRARAARRQGIELH